MTRNPQSLNFLLVDDDDVCQFIHRRVLELAGLGESVHAANNGRVAIEMLKRAAVGSIPLPDVIFLDLEMPMMNGLAFLEALQTLDCIDRQQIAIVLLTSSVSEKDRRFAMSLGVKHYLSKPLTQDSLKAVVSQLYGSDAHSQ